MFNVGDKIVYPGQGVGIISCIEEREFKGEKQNFYEIDIVNSTMKLKLPASRFENANIRLVSDSEEIDNSLKDIVNYTEEVDNLQKSVKREREENNSKKVKNGTFDDYSGPIRGGSEMYRNILNVQVKNCGNANSSESQTLNSMRGFVVQEISEVKGMSIEEANEFLDGHLDVFSNNK